MWSREDERREALDAVLQELRQYDVARDRAAACAYLIRHLTSPQPGRTGETPAPGSNDPLPRVRQHKDLL